MQHQQTAVLIVGGGITGLSTALFLARQGVHPILVERHPSTAITPQTRAFNPRSMEIYRAFGLEEEIREHRSMLADLPEMIGADSLVGQERFRVDLLAHVQPPPTLSPTGWGLVDQDELERIVRAAAERSGADVRFGTELVSFDAAAEGVTAAVRDRSGAEYRVRAEYLVAADGHRAGVRNRLGIGVEQCLPPSPGIYFVFDADLSAVLRGRRFLLAYLDRPAPGTVLVPLRTFGRWMLGVPGETTEDEERCVELARLAVGVPDLDVTLVPPVPGRAQKVARSTTGGWVAQRYRAGRVFLAGDAAHVVPPSGSYGANTGIADAHNLAWKLAAVLGGRAGDALLDTYEQERLPVAQVTLETAMQLLRDRHQGTDVTRIDDLTMIFGYRYDSAAVLTEPPTPDGPVEDPRNPSGRPGLRAPHIWLGTRSTHDLFTSAFSLLTGPDGSGWATPDGVERHELDEGALAAYGIERTGAALVRPDGFVAWRARHLPENPERELRHVLARLLATG